MMRYGVIRARAAKKYGKIVKSTTATRVLIYFYILMQNYNLQNSKHSHPDALILLQRVQERRVPH